MEASMTHLETLSRCVFGGTQENCWKSRLRTRQVRYYLPLNTYLNDWLVVYHRLVTLLNDSAECGSKYYEVTQWSSWHKESRKKLVTVPLWFNCGSHILPASRQVSISQISERKSVTYVVATSPFCDDFANVFDVEPAGYVLGWKCVRTQKQIARISPVCSWLFVPFCLPSRTSVASSDLSLIFEDIRANKYEINQCAT